MAVHPGDIPPAPWQSAKKIPISTTALKSAETLGMIRSAYLTRTPTVYEVDRNLQAIDVGSLQVEPWGLPVDFEFVAETTWEFLWRNTVRLERFEPVVAPSRASSRAWRHAAGFSRWRRDASRWSYGLV